MSRDEKDILQIWSETFCFHFSFYLTIFDVNQNGWCYIDNLGLLESWKILLILNLIYIQEFTDTLFRKYVKLKNFFMKN